MSHSRKRRMYSYSYLAEISADYAEKLEDPQWSWAHSVLEEWKEDLDRKIRTYKETELCTRFQAEKILAYILRQKS